MDPEVTSIMKDYGIAGIFIAYIIQQNFFLVKKLTIIIESNTKAIEKLKSCIDEKTISMKR